MMLGNNLEFLKDEPTPYRMNSKSREHFLNKQTVAEGRLNKNLEMLKNNLMNSLHKRRAHLPQRGNSKANSKLST